MEFFHKLQTGNNYFIFIYFYFLFLFKNISLGPQKNGLYYPHKSLLVKVSGASYRGWPRWQDLLERVYDNSKPRASLSKVIILSKPNHCCYSPQTAPTCSFLRPITVISECSFLCQPLKLMFPPLSTFEGLWAHLDWVKCSITPRWQAVTSWTGVSIWGSLMQ